MAKNQSQVKRDIINLQNESNKLAAKGAKLTEDDLKRQKEIKKEIVEQVKLLKKLNEAKLKALAEEESKINNLSGIYGDLHDSQKAGLAIIEKSNSKNRETATKVLDVNRSIAQLDPVKDHHQILELMSKRNDLMNSLDKRSRGLVAHLEKENELADEYAAMSEDEKRALQAQHAAAEKVKQTLQGISETIETAVRKLWSVKGLFGGLFYAAGAFASKLVEVNKQIGQVGVLTDGAANKAAALSFFFGDSVGALKGLSQELGGTEGLTTSVQLQTNLIASNLGIGAQEAATLTASMARLNGGSLDTAGNLADAARDFARMNNIPVSQMMGDLAASTEQFALFGKQGGKNIIEAAGYAAKLGISMGQASGIAENLLDFENSITKELELGARLGKNINLSKARQLAYEGDIAGATKATLEQLGGIDAFNKMDYYQKKATADLLGVSVAELQKMATNQEKAAKVSKLMSGDFSNIGESLKAVASNLLPKAMKGFGSFLMLSSQANQSFQLLGKTKIGEKLGNMFSKSRFSATDMADKAGDTVGKAGTASKGLGIGEKLKSLAGGLKEMGNPKVLFGALNLLPAAIGFTAMTAGVLGLAGVALFGVAAGAGLEALGLGLVGFGNAMAAPTPLGPVGLVAPVALALLGAAMYPLAGALSLLSPLVSAFGVVIQSAFQGAVMLVDAMTTSIIKFMNNITLDKVASIGLLSLAFMGLAASLMFLGSAGIFALPTLLGIAAAAGGIAIVAELFGLGGNSEETGAIVEGGGETFETQVISEIQEVAKAIKGLNLNIDGRRLTNSQADSERSSIGLNRVN